LLRLFGCLYYCFTIYLFLQDAVHVSYGVSVHRQELKTAHTASGIGLANTWRYTSTFELLVMDGKSVWNM